MMRRALGLILGALVGAGIRADIPAEDAVLPHALECARPRLRGPELSGVLPHGFGDARFQDVRALQHERPAGALDHTLLR
jgi:hypothetical protein